MREDVSSWNLCLCSAWRLGSGLLFGGVIFSAEVLKWAKAVSDVLSVDIQCHQTLKHQCVTNVILIPNEKHGTLPPLRKKTNSIPGKTRTLAVCNCLKSFFLVSLSEYTRLQFGMWLKANIGMPRIKKWLTGRGNNNNVFLITFIYFTLRC